MTAPTERLAGSASKLVDVTRAQVRRCGLAVVVAALMVPGCGSDGDLRLPPKRERLPLTKEAAGNPHYADLAPFVGQAWANDLQAEEEGTEEHGLVTVQDGVRTSRPAPSCACRPLRVWLFGGSAAFGIGQRDDETIASQMVEVAEERGVSLSIRNLATPGWTTEDEVNAFTDRLASDEPPDLAIFFDGANDVTYEVVNTAFHGTDPQRPPTTPDPGELRKYMARLPEVDPARAGEQAAEKYLANQRRAEDAGARYDVEVRFVLQPDAFAAPRLTRMFATELGASYRFVSTSDVAIAARAAEKDIAPSVLDLRHIFDDHPSPVLFSSVHMNEEGASVVAAALVDRVLLDRGDE